MLITPRDNAHSVCDLTSLKLPDWNVAPVQLDDHDHFCLISSTSLCSSSFFLFLHLTLSLLFFFFFPPLCFFVPPRARAPPPGPFAIPPLLLSKTSSSATSIVTFTPLPFSSSSSSSPSLHLSVSPFPSSTCPHFLPRPIASSSRLLLPSSSSFLSTLTTNPAPLLIPALD